MLKKKNNSDSSSDEDDEQMKQIMEAADPILLTNSMYTNKSESKDQNATTISNEVNSSETKTITTKVKLKSQRYLPEDDYENGTDLHFPETVQEHVYKKLSESLNKQIEFFDFTKHAKTKKEKKHKSRVKLLKDSDCYLQEDEVPEELNFPQNKPEIKRRKVLDEDVEEQNDIEKIKAVAVSGEDIMSGEELKKWAKKTEKKNKIFKYKADKKGVLHEMELENEFTALRKKNKWNESKIKEKFKN